MKSIPQKVGLFGTKDRKIHYREKNEKKLVYIGKNEDNNHDIIIGTRDDILGPAMVWQFTEELVRWYIGPGMTDESFRILKGKYKVGPYHL